MSKHGKLKIIPLGGLGEVGKNMMAYEFQNQILVVDTGIHTKGWTRELWIQALGMPAVLPPPEEVREVKTAIEAAQAKKSRTKK